MNAGLTREVDSMRVRASLIERQIPAERLAVILTVLGLIASLVTFVSFEEARSQSTHDLVPTTVARSQLYYAAHATQVLLLISAGLAALLSANWRRIEPTYLGRFVLFIGAALLMTARGYSLSQLLSTKLVDWTGPFPCFISLLVFFGARRRNWDLLARIMVGLAAVFSAMVLLGVAALSAFTRAEGVARLGGALNVLFWPAAWIAFSQYRRGSRARGLRFVPMLVYAFGSFFTQTRLNFVMLFAFLVVYSWVQHKRRVPQGGTWIAGLTLAVLVSLFVAVFLRDTRAFARGEDVALAFSARLDEDTRSGQLEWFAESVRPEELLLGRGSLATWHWRIGEYSGGTDVGYLTLLFYGGVPLLITYIATHVTPCLTVLRRNPSSLQLSAAAVVFLWGIRMLSSSHPSLTLDYYPILFCVGACISREPFGVQSRGR